MPMTKIAIGALSAPCERMTMSNVTTRPHSAARLAARSHEPRYAMRLRRNAAIHRTGATVSAMAMPIRTAPATTTVLLPRGSTDVSSKPTAAHDSAASTNRSVFVSRSARFRHRDYAALDAQMLLNGQ